MSKPTQAKKPNETEPKDAQGTELSPAELEQVNGGIGSLLVPAVQNVREAAAQSSRELPTESLSFNFAKVSK